MNSPGFDQRPINRACVQPDLSGATPSPEIHFRAMVIEQRT
jgi:hypothetical protein